jgi:hypothetical protein
MLPENDNSDTLLIRYWGTADKCNASGRAVSYALAINDLACCYSTTQAVPSPIAVRNQFMCGRP